MSAVRIDNRAPIIILIFLSLLIYCAALIVFYQWSNEVIDLKSGFIICKSDCRDYDMLSDYLVATGWFHPIDRDAHSWPFYWGFVGYVAGLKSLFADFWQPVFVAANGMLAVLLVWVGARGQQHPMPRLIGICCCFLLLAVNFRLLQYSKYLLTDYIFGVVACIALVFFARAAVTGERVLALVATALTGLTMILRPTGVLFGALALAFWVSRWLPIRPS